MPLKLSHQLKFGEVLCILALIYRYMISHHVSYPRMGMFGDIKTRFQVKLMDDIKAIPKATKAGEAVFHMEAAARWDFLYD